MKIGIYAPVKNEEKHVLAWHQSCKDADYICVLDTGSTDKTIDLMTNFPHQPKIYVHNARIIPWRFDDAFNAAMYMLPEDIDVCIRLDLDERLQPGWREALEKAWVPGTTRLRYEYVWNWNADGTPGLKWWGDRIHARAGYRWRGATHEGLEKRDGQESQVFTDKVKIWQFPDVKAKNDLPLLLEAMRENPSDERTRAYLAREYMYQGLNEEAKWAYVKFLENTDRDKSHPVERAIAYRNLGKVDVTEQSRARWLKRGYDEFPDHRECAVDLAQMYYNNQNWNACVLWAMRAIDIKERPGDYSCTAEAWGSLPYDLASIAAYKMGDLKESLAFAREALKFAPTDTRIQANVQLIEKDLNGTHRTN